MINARSWLGGCLLTSVLSLVACSSASAPEVHLATLERARPPAVHPWSTAARAQLKREIDAALAPVGGSPRNGFVVLADDRSVLYARNATVPRTPASTLKVVTAATALAILGPRYRFTTRMVALHPLAGHVLPDDLWLVGGGDPVLSSDDVHDGIAHLAAAGLRTIAGKAMIDASAFGGPAQNPHWAADDLNLDYAAGTSSLSLDGDVAIFSVQPQAFGSPAQVRLLPANRGVRMTGQIITSGSSAVTIDHQEGVNSFRLGGTIVPGAEQRFPIPMGDVPHFVGGVVDAMLHARGISTLGPSEVGLAPIGGVTLWLHRSPPLAEIVHHMLVVSDNHVAEQLLRLLGTTVHQSGTESAGIAVEHTFLARIGVSAAGMHTYDGSGLAPADRIAPLTLAEILADADARAGSPLVLGLPRVGIEGTVANHQLSAAAGRVRAKSGHIMGVDGLVGVVVTRHHGRVAFAFLANDADDGTVENAEDTILDAISRY